jgi:DNA-binding NarL/FixJ family response regulator
MPLLKTFLVEDSAVIRANLIKTLEELAPVKVIGWAADEVGALGWLGEPGNRADLVIVDLFLAGGSGLGVLLAASNLPRRNVFVVLSNYSTADVRRRCLALGAERVFDKSGEIDDLLAYCEELAADEAADVA